jgi:hypothetical protein
MDGLNWRRKLWKGIRKSSYFGGEFEYSIAYDCPIKCRPGCKEPVYFYKTWDGNKAHNGCYMVIVGQEWLEKNLTPEELIEFAVYRLTGK